MTTTQTTCDRDHDNPRYTYICAACLERERALLNTMLAALEDAVKLFEAWEGGIFNDVGIAWVSPPPAIAAARAAIEAAR